MLCLQAGFQTINKEADMEFLKILAYLSTILHLSDNSCILSRQDCLNKEFVTCPTRYWPREELEIYCLNLEELYCNSLTLIRRLRRVPGSILPEVHNKTDFYSFGRNLWNICQKVERNMSKCRWLYLITYAVTLLRKALILFLLIQKVEGGKPMQIWLKFDNVFCPASSWWETTLDPTALSSPLYHTLNDFAAWGKTFKGFFLNFWMHSRVGTRLLSTMKPNAISYGGDFGPAQWILAMQTIVTCFEQANNRDYRSNKLRLYLRPWSDFRSTWNLGLSHSKSPETVKYTHRYNSIVKYSGISKSYVHTDYNKR